MRVLQILPDTDASDVNEAAVELHAALTRSGLQLRTVALAPGRTGGLASIVPAMAPSRRAISALTQVRSESRWADVVLFQGVRALPPGRRLLRSGPPVVLALPEGQVPDRVLRALRGRRPVHVVTPGPVPTGSDGDPAVFHIAGIGDPNQDPDRWADALRAAVS